MFKDKGGQFVVIACLGSISAFFGVVGTYLAVKDLPNVVYVTVNFGGMLLFGWTASLSENRLINRTYGKEQLANMKGLLALEFYVLHSVMYLGPLMLSFLAAHYLIPIVTPMIPPWAISLFGVIEGAASGGDETMILFFAVIFILILTAVSIRELMLQKENQQLKAALAVARKKRA